MMMTGFLVAFCILAETVEQMLYRAVGKRLAPAARLLTPAIGLHLVGFLAWLELLRLLPLGVALPLTALTHVTIAMAGKIFFGERVDARRWVGIFLVMAGFSLVATS